MEQSCLLGTKRTLKQSRSWEEHGHCESGGIEYEPDKQQVPRLVKALGLTGARCVAIPGSDDVGGNKVSELSRLRRTAKRARAPEQAKDEDSQVGEELKPFQSVSARCNILAMDRPDFLYSVKDLMRKMTSPSSRDLFAFKRVAHYTIKHPRMVCRYHGPNWTRTLRNSGERPICEGMVQNYGNPGGEQWGI